MRLEREAEEYQRLMAEHACSGGGATGKNIGSASEAKTQKKKKKKKKGKADEPTLAAVNQQEDEDTTRGLNDGGMAAEYEQWPGDMHDGSAGGQPGGQSTLSAEAEAIRAEAIANGLGALGDDELQDLIEQQRAIEEECARNHVKQRQAAPAPAASAKQPAQSTARGQSTLPAQRKVPAQPTPSQRTAPVQRAAPAKSTAPLASTAPVPPPFQAQMPPGTRAQQDPVGPDEPTHTAPKPSGKFAQQQQEEHAQNGSRNAANAQWARQQPNLATGGKRGGAGRGEAHGDSHRASTGVFNDGCGCAPPLDVNGSKANGKHGENAYRRLSEPHAADGKAAYATDAPGATRGVHAARGGNGHMHSPDSGVSSLSAASLGGFQGGGAPDGHSHLQQPHVPPPPPPPVAAHAYSDGPTHTSACTAGGWQASGIMHAHSQPVYHAGTTAAPMHQQQPMHQQPMHQQPLQQQYVPQQHVQQQPMQQQNPQLGESWNPYAQQGAPTASMHAHHDKHLEHTDSTLNYTYDDGSGYGMRDHHGQCAQYQQGDFGQPYPPDAAGGWQAPPWSEAEDAQSHAHQYGTMGHGGPGANMHGQHAMHRYESGLWATPQGDPAMLQPQRASHLGSAQSVHAQHAEGFWSEGPAPPMQPLNPDAAAAHPVGRRMHAQSNPSARGALFQAYSKRNPGAIPCPRQPPCTC